MSRSRGGFVRRGIRLAAVGVAAAVLILGSPVDRTGLPLRAQSAHMLPLPRAVALPNGMATVQLAMTDARASLDGFVQEVHRLRESTTTARLRLQRAASEVQRRLHAAGGSVADGGALNDPAVSQDATAGAASDDATGESPAIDQAGETKGSTSEAATSEVGSPAGSNGATVHAYDRLSAATREFRARVAAAHAVVDDIGQRIRQVRITVEQQSRRLDQAMAGVRAQRFGDGGDEASARVLEVGNHIQADVAALREELRALELDLAALRSGLGRQERGVDAKLVRRLSEEALALGLGGLGGPGAFQVCPVDPPRSYSDDFGAPRWAGGFHTHQGNDIFAPAGTPIRAVFDGKAEATPNTLGGLSVTLYGAQGYVYNAHLSAYGTLGPVNSGTIIGYVGNTGDAIGTSPHNHFEWHPGGGSAVNPFDELNRVC